MHPMFSYTILKPAILIYSRKAIELLKKKGITIPENIVFLPGIHCKGESPWGRSKACTQAGCLGMEGINDLPGIALPCRKVLRGAVFGLAPMS